jgi:phosphoserine phosphatase
MKILNPLIRMSCLAAHHRSSPTILHGGLDDSSIGSGGMEGIPPIVSPIISSSSSSSSSIMHQLPPLAKNSRRVILVQHGQTDYNHRGMLQGGDDADGHDVELNFAGKVEAALISSALQGLPLGEASSKENGERPQDPPIRIVNHRLGEMRLGEYESMVSNGPESTSQSRSKLESLHSIMQANTQVPWPGTGGESIAALKARAMAGVEQVLRGFPDVDHVCIVAHAQWSKVLLMQLLADDNDNGKHPPGVGVVTPQSIEQGNACINVLDVDSKGRWKLEMMNHLQHLEAAFA